jgi:hypothetical protein
MYTTSWRTHKRTVCISLICVSLWVGCQHFGTSKAKENIPYKICMYANSSIYLVNNKIFGFIMTWMIISTCSLGHTLDLISLFTLKREKVSVTVGLDMLVVSCNFLCWLFNSAYCSEDIILDMLTVLCKNMQYLPLSTSACLYTLHVNIKYL